MYFTRYWPFKKNQPTIKLKVPWKRVHCNIFQSKCLQQQLALAFWCILGSHFLGLHTISPGITPKFKLDSYMFIFQLLQTSPPLTVIGCQRPFLMQCGLKPAASGFQDRHNSKMDLITAFQENLEFWRLEFLNNGSPLWKWETLDQTYIIKISSLRRNNTQTWIIFKVYYWYL